MSDMVPDSTFTSLALLWRNLVFTAGCVVLVASCVKDQTEAKEFTLERFDQEGQSGVLLNETLVFHFSEELDPSSVTMASARISDAHGHSVPGEFEVRRDQLLFRPALALAKDLLDGGFRPKETYSCELGGFPLVSGLRARDGRVLESCYRSVFSTVSGSQGERVFF